MSPASFLKSTIAVAALSLVTVPTASAADTTAPVIKAKAANTTIGGLAQLETDHDAGLGSGWYITGPAISVQTNEAGTITFIGRDWTGKALGRISGPIVAGGTISEIGQTDKGRSIDSYIFPSKIISCAEPLSGPCGEQWLLKQGTVYSIEAFVTDAAGNKSSTFKIYGVYAGTVQHFTF